ncbi:MAG: DEAD/DEAH box helicase [Rikenellaceae bacterium]
MADFRELGINNEVIELLNAKGIIVPTTVQQFTIPNVLKGEDVTVRSQTGSGKTLAYLLPLFQNLSYHTASKLLVLAPTRELAQQIGRVCSEYSQTSLAVVYGGVDYDQQKEMFADDPRIIVATPGRLQDLIEQGIAKLSNLRYFLLDEVDQMVDMGFHDPIMQLAKLRDSRCQTMFFSATLPDGVVEIISSISSGCITLSCDDQPLAAQNITQSGYYVEQSMMDQLLLHIIRAKSPDKAIVFCRSKKMADRLTSILKESNFAAEAIHSDRSQAAREHILRRFTEGETKILVATDLMARGIDVDGVTRVFNFGLPQTPEQYIHRIGRTGRAGACGEAISLLCPDEKKILDATCALMRQPIPISTNHPYMTTAVTTMLSGVALRKKVRK